MRKKLSFLYAVKHCFFVFVVISSISTARQAIGYELPKKGDIQVFGMQEQSYSIKTSSSDGTVTLTADDGIARTQVIFNKPISEELKNKIKNKEQFEVVTEILKYDYKQDRSELILLFIDENTKRFRDAKNELELKKYEKSFKQYEKIQQKYSDDQTYVFNTPLNGATNELFCWKGKLVTRSGNRYVVYAKNYMNSMMNDIYRDIPLVEQQQTEGAFAFELAQGDKTMLLQDKNIVVCGVFSDTVQLLNGKTLPVLTETNVKQ